MDMFNRLDIQSTRVFPFNNSPSIDWFNNEQFLLFFCFFVVPSLNMLFLTKTVIFNELNLNIFLVFIFSVKKDWSSQKEST